LHHQLTLGGELAAGLEGIVEHGGNQLAGYDFGEGFAGDRVDCHNIILVSLWYSGLTTIPILEAKKGDVNRSKVLILGDCGLSCPGFRLQRRSKNLFEYQTRQGGEKDNHSVKKMTTEGKRKPQRKIENHRDHRVSFWEREGWSGIPDNRLRR